MTKSVYSLNELVVHSSHGFDRFILFGYESYEAVGGIGDVIFSSDDIEDVVSKVNELIYSTYISNSFYYDVIEVYDTKNNMAKVDIEATHKAIEDAAQNKQVIN